jgi:hypothetical protein
MSAVSCDVCDGDILVTNRAFAGYCSPDCRDEDRQRRQQRRDRPKDIVTLMLSVPSRDGSR